MQGEAYRLGGPIVMVVGGVKRVGVAAREIQILTAPIISINKETTRVVFLFAVHN